jgi:hypothetical protein
MQKYLSFIILSFAISFYHNIYSQTIHQFPADPSLFPGQISEFMGSNLAVEQSSVLEEFIARWDSAFFNPAETHTILNTANLLRAMNARPLPHMLNYIVLLNSFAEHDAERRHFTIWHEAFTDLLENRNMTIQSVNALMALIEGLVARNELYRSIAVTWKVSASGFSLVHDDSLLIVFPGTDLMGFNHIDTLTIFRTSGTLCPVSMTWKGEGGRVTWERAGLDAGEAFAMLNNYTIDLNRSEYSADFALFNFNRYFQLPINGRLTDRVMTTRNPGEAVYPRFTSYRQEFSIREIYRNVDYEGGLSMHGAKLIGSGGADDNARLKFYMEGDICLKAESKYFVFKPQGVSSLNTRIVFYLENDSVFHPDIHFNFNDNSRELSLNQNEKVISQSPWDNQFHKIDMSFAQLLWKIDEPEMILTMTRAGSIGNANFKSLNFFDREHYQRLQGMDSNHPLLLLSNFAHRHDSGAFPAGEYAGYLRMPIPAVRHQLLELTLGGFIFYDTDTDLIRPRQKLYDYLQANIRRIDYDIIDFASSTRAPQENAILNLASHELKINGIPQVHISNTQKVNIFPDKNTVIMKRNRNFLFDGTINAGNLSFFGSLFTFDYDRFSISLQNIDSLSLRIRMDEKDVYGQARLTSVRNLIRNVTGELNIDKPFNKSGRINHHDYPRFSSTGNSYVFYDHPRIQNGAYRKDEFYFELYPFTLDSLNSFRNDEIRFKGRLVTGIFPEIEEMLTLQEDHSLGVKHALPENGLPVYDGKGTYYYDLKLSNNGLRGSGRLNYLASELYSADFLFLPDSMNATTDDFFVAKQTRGTEFPAVNSKNNIVQWLPGKEIMTVHRKDKNFNMFDDKAELNGKLMITPSGLSGSGLISLGNAEINSGSYLFKSESLKADNSDFTLRNPDKPANTLSAGGLTSYIDLETRTGEFTSNHGNSNIALPMNGLTANPESITWKMDLDEFEMLSSADNQQGVNGTKFTSTVYGHDSLSFFSPLAVLDYSSHLLRANQVKYIQIADATIFPNDETLLIGEKADILPFSDARIITGRDSLHEIYNADVKILARNKFSGSGNYDYRDEMDVIQPVYFDRISVKNDSETIATGKIEIQDNFKLSPAFSFAGETEMASSRPHLNFRGAARISHDCAGLADNWVAFENTADPVEIMIPVPVQPMSADRVRIYSGIFVASDSVHIYPAFFSERKNYTDQLIVQTHGYMKYDNHSGEYRIASMEKLRNPEQPGSYISFNPGECLLRGEGQLELGVTLGQFKLTSAGTVINKVELNETSLEAMISLDFVFSKDALALIARNADSIPGQPMDSNAYYFSRGINEFIGKEKADQYRNSAAREGRQVRIPDELQKTFILSHVSLHWNKANRSYVSRGKIGVAFIDGMPVNKMFTGYLEITKRRSGDYIDFYIELEENNWYYFGYTRGVMQAFSSNRAFVDIIGNVALRNRRDKGPSREERYVYMLASDTKIEQFLKTYRNHLAATADEITQHEPFNEADKKAVEDLTSEESNIELL